MTKVLAQKAISPPLASRPDFGLSLDLRPMDPKTAENLPDTDGPWQYEPKWDFRCLAFKAVGTPRGGSFPIFCYRVDFAIIGFFIATPVLQQSSSFLWLDYSVAALLGIDMVARAFASRSVLRWLIQPTLWVDIFILLTLLMPSAFANLAFPRILRLWSLFMPLSIW
jgi:hypothetical protein